MQKATWLSMIAATAALMLAEQANAQSAPPPPPPPSTSLPSSGITDDLMAEARREYQMLTEIEGFDKFATDSDEKALRGLVPYEFRGAGEQAEAFFIADSFARCAVRLSEKRAKKLLNRSMKGGIHIEQEQAYYDRLKGCAVRRAAIDREFMRGSLAVHILLEDVETVAVEPVLKKEELIAFLGSVEVADGRFTKNQTSTQLGFQCRAALAPDLAYKVLEMDPGSEAEAEAIKRVAEKTSYCDSLFQKDPTNWFARVFLARGLYHWQQFREDHPAGGSA